MSVDKPASSVSFSCKLYRVIRSGCAGLDGAGVEEVEVVEETAGRGGWKDCGGY